MIAMQARMMAVSSPELMSALQRVALNPVGPALLTVALSALRLALQPVKLFA
jgi:hypothetical protein